MELDPNGIPLILGATDILPALVQPHVAVAIELVGVNHVGFTIAIDIGPVEIGTSFFSGKLELVDMVPAAPIVMHISPRTTILLYTEIVALVVTRDVREMDRTIKEP